MNKVRLGDIFRTTSGSTPLTSDRSFYDGGTISWLTSSEVGQGKIIFTKNYITQKALEKTSVKILPKHSVVIAMYGATVGEVGILDIETTTNQAVCGILPNKEKADPFYIFYQLLNRKKELIKLASGSARTNISQKVIQEFELYLPNIETQTAIARVLSSLDEKIELNNKINRELENLAKMIYEYWFMQKIDKRWEKGKLSDIANITMGQSPDGSSYNEQGEGIIFYQGSTDFGARFPVIRQYTTKPARFAVAGDILLSIRAPVGTINFANKKCCIGRGLAALNSKIGSITHLYFILKDLEMVFNRRNTDGTTFGAITKDDLFSLSVKIPPKNILIQYEKIVKPIFDKQFEIAEESSNLAQLRDFLLPLLMNGQVKVKNG